MKKKIMIAGMILSFGCSFPSSVMAAEIVSAPSDVYVNAEVTQRLDDIDYVYKVINGKLYKRLYNFTEKRWEGDWVLA